MFKKKKKKIKDSEEEKQLIEIKRAFFVENSLVDSIANYFAVFSGEENPLSLSNSYLSLEIYIFIKLILQINVHPICNIS